MQQPSNTKCHNMSLSAYKYYGNTCCVFAHLGLWELSDFSFGSRAGEVLEPHVHTKFAAVTEENINET